MSDIHEIRSDSRWLNIKHQTDYKVLHVGTHSETREKLVVYQRIGDRCVWIRPYDLFLEKFQWLHD